jgi:hypothetical protein
MKKRIAVFDGGLAPITHGLPSNIAASIGRTLVRHTYMESLQRKVLNLLLEISIKQSRLVVRIPQPKQFPNLVQTLLQYHGLYPKVKINYNDLGAAIDAADRARNALAHSLILKNPQGPGYLIQLVRGSWELDQDVFSVTRALQPQTVALHRAYLSARRKEVEKAIIGMRNLLALISATMKALHEKRRTEAAWDRRRRPQSGNTPQGQPQASPG